MEHVQSGSQAVSAVFPMQPPSFGMSSLHQVGPYIMPQRTEKFVTRVPGVLTETKVKDEPNETPLMRNHDVNDMHSHAEFQNLLICTESIQAEEHFHTNENASSEQSTSTAKIFGQHSNNSKLQHNHQVPAGSVRRVNKLPVVSSASVPREKTVKKARNTSPDKRRQTRPRRVVDEPIIREVTVVDEQSIIPLSEVVGDLEFEDLEPEDLDLVRHLPPAGNVNIVDRCAGSLRGIREFETRLQDVLHRDSRGGLLDDVDHDSDATLSILSEETPGEVHSAENPATNMSMLVAYRMVFDPPVPAVVTIPTSIVKLNGPDDWRAESSALQYLMKKNVDPKKHITKRARKIKRDENRQATMTKHDEDVGRLIAAIEIKSNKVVHLKRPVFTIQHALPERKKPCREKSPVKSAPTVREKATLPDLAARNGALVKKFSLDSLCDSFLQGNLFFLQPEELTKGLQKKSQLEKSWNQRVSLTDSSLQKDLSDIIQDTQMHLRELVYGKERAELIVDEKFILDAEETEKRLTTATEKAKCHVINMFEENRRQYELQRTLDYATCKYDMLAINTRNMRRRADVPLHSRLMEDLPSSSSGNATGSPPHSSQSSLPLAGSQMRRRRNHFASVLKDSLEDKEIYDDLASINRGLKDDPERERARLVTKSADVVPDNNRLTVDGKVFHRNQPVMVEHHEHGKYPGTLLQFSQTEIVIKRSSEGRVERSRFPVGFLMDRRIVLKKRSISLKSNNHGSMR